MRGPGTALLKVGDSVEVPWTTYDAEVVTHQGKVVGLGSDWRSELKELH